MSKTYTLKNIELKIYGNAVGISLTGIGLPGNALNKHTTVWYYPNGIPQIIKQRYSQGVKYKGPLSFTLQYYGKHSDLINGQLKNFIMDLRKKYPKYAPTGNQSKIHVKLRN